MSGKYYLVGIVERRRDLNRLRHVLYSTCVHIYTRIPQDYRVPVSLLIQALYIYIYMFTFFFFPLSSFSLFVYLIFIKFASFVKFMQTMAQCIRHEQLQLVLVQARYHDCHQAESKEILGVVTEIYFYSRDERCCLLFLIFFL